jgi:hypothetical protein
MTKEEILFVQRVESGYKQARRAILESTPRNDEELHLWVFNVLGIWIPKYRVCPDHCSPFEYFADRYFGRVRKSLAWACRAGSKSFLMGMICWLKGRKRSNWEANILGGSLDQAQKSYEATSSFWSAVADIGGMSVLEKEPMQTKTVFNNGSKYGIKAASSKAQRGPHPQSLNMDEIDEMDIQVFNTALAQPQSKHGSKSEYAFASTMHKSNWLMSNWVDHAQKRGYTLYKWCIFETMEGCYDYECDTCQLEKWCQGRMKDVMEDAETDQIDRGLIAEGDRAIMGFNSVEDVIDKVVMAQRDEDTATGRTVRPMDIDAELFCMRPSREGLVYKDFDVGIHVIHEMEIPKEWRRYRSFDFGVQNPFVCLFIALDPEDRVYIYDEIYVQGRTTVEMAPTVVSYDHSRFEWSVADISGLEQRRDLMNSGIPTVAYQSAVTDGIQWVRNSLRIRADGKPTLFVSDRCPNTIWEMVEGYRYPDNKVSDKPIKENDHACDCIKNFFVAYRKGGDRQSHANYGRRRTSEVLDTQGTVKESSI